ncbi:class II fructose-bisphosphate aldolase [Microbacterium luticocti]|uniref:class II fructose-bisphosphate aldolase n=1 Tax=Microbacterium luticocti TaxID=451764 RepID=UPI000428BEBB|nr:class II fructose-bisphosphate aldolase [Microbacterium luticocti]
MPLVPTAQIVTAAAAAGSGAAAFNVVTLETAEALVGAAERAARPLILQISQNCAAFHGSLTPLAAATRAVAEASDAVLALHLDHAEDADLARRAVDLGFGSVMFDGAALPYDENVRVTAAVAAYAHERGAWIEAELGEIGGKDGAHAAGVRTDPDEAAAFVAATGVDLLAVAVGSTHARTDRTTRLDLDLIARLRDAVPVPLVLHGSSGVADDHLREAVAAGIVKVNVSTHLNGHFTRAVRSVLDADERIVDLRRYLGPGRDAMADEAARLLALIAG